MLTGEAFNKSDVSAYQPDKDVSDFTAQVKVYYSDGLDILNKPWTELNDRSVIEDMNRGQLMFNAYVDTNVDDPNEAWKWRGTRSKARNKGIAMHAQLAGNYLLPLFMAQNENDDIDRDASEIMRCIIEWMAQSNVSDYQSSFLQMVFAMETNPVTFLGAEYNEVYQKIKQAQDNGKITVEEILDEVNSGFRCPIWSANQVLITNAFERNIQRQKCIIQREYVEYADLEQQYKDHKNWNCVKVGYNSIYNEDDGLFYDIKDDDHTTLCARETYKNRLDDTEVVFVGGIYMSDDDIEANPIKHRDNRNAPKYNVVPFGFHRIGEHFFYYKSMMNELGWDEMRYNAMDELVFNRALLDVDMPIAVYGTDKKIDSSVTFPNSVTVFEDKDARIQPLLPQSNLVGGFRELENINSSMDEASISATMSGQLPEASQKAYSVSQAQASAKKLIGAVGKSLAESVVMYGDLMKDIALNKITVPELQELTGGKTKLKYKKFFISKKTGSSEMDKVIDFDEKLIGKDFTPEEKTKMELMMLEESGWPNTKKSISKVNPELFSKMKYLCKVDIEEMFTKNQEYWQPMLLALRREFLNDPNIDMEKLDRKVLYAHLQSEGEDIIKKQEQLPPQGMPEQQPAGQSPLVSQTLNKATANVANNIQ